MRLLCLHGVGSSASILESQLRPFMRAVDPSFEFEFVDGPISSSRGPGVSPDMEGPFFSHTAGYSPEDMMDALDHLDATLEELGPFDGVLGFSQGGAVTISYLYELQARGEVAPFKFALICSSVAPCSSNLSAGQDVIQRLCSLGHDVTRTSTANDDFLGPKERMFKELLAKTVVAAKKNGQLQPDYDMSVYRRGNGSRAPRVMHPKLFKERIQVPTVHAIGKRDFDFMRNMSGVAFDLCDPKYSRKLEHSGGHSPPQKEPEVKALVSAMEWAINQADKSGCQVRL